jgi:hypothetical protein
MLLRSFVHCVEYIWQDCPSKMGCMYLDMFLSELVGGGASVFAAVGSLPSPPAIASAPASSLALAPAPVPSAFLGVGHTLKEFPSAVGVPAAACDDDLNQALAMSMLSSGPSALKMAIVAPSGVRQVLTSPTFSFIHSTTTCTLEMLRCTKSCSCFLAKRRVHVLLHKVVLMRLRFRLLK